MIVLSHPTGNPNVRAVAKSLVSEKKMHSFFTSIAAFRGNIWYKLGTYAPFAEFRRRNFDAGLKTYTRLYPFYDLGRAIASKFDIWQLLKHESGLFCVDNIYRKHDKYVAGQLERAKANGATAVYAYEDGALETFIEAKRLGLKCIYDLPIAYWETGRKLMQEEAERLPQWAETLGGGIKDSAAKLEHKRKELELADVVVGPGSFVMDSLPAWAKSKIKIMSPFGSPEGWAEIKKEINLLRSLRVLFVGSMGQRKGLGDLFEAMKLLNQQNIELVIMGSLLAPMDFYRKQYAGFTYEQGRSHTEVLELMRTCDVFCLPSIVEGRALVMQEAMSQGLPIIITPNTGGEDLVIEGETGFLVPIRSPQAIAEKISWFVEHRDAIPEMGEKARQHAQKYTWENYGHTIIQQLSSVI